MNLLRRMIALISAAAQVRVLSVSYRLAPEDPFPPPWTTRWLPAARGGGRDVALDGPGAHR